MSPTPFEESLREALREHGDIRPSPAEVTRARARLDSRIARDRTSRLLGAVTVTAVVLALVALVVVPGRGGPDPTRPADRTDSAAPLGPTPAESPGVPLPGAPVPPEAQGTWAATVVSGGATRHATLTLREDTYVLCHDAVDCLSGSIVTQGDLLVFYDEQWCGAPGETGAGRYAWTVRDVRLTLTAQGPDPCYRAPTLGDAAWRRA